MFRKCIVPRLATALGLTAAFAIVTILASSPSSARASQERPQPTGD
jgi:hypothetical protein